MSDYCITFSRVKINQIVVEFHVVQNHPSTCDGWTNTVRTTHSHQWTTVVSADLGSVDLTGTCLIISVVIDREEFFIGAYRALKTLNAIPPHLIAIEEHYLRWNIVELLEMVQPMKPRTMPIDDGSISGPHRE
jgi:hypothetical protein